jgi:hypothetical protein
MTSLRLPDYSVHLDYTNPLVNQLSGYSLNVKIHRFSKSYPLQGTLIINLSSLWLTSSNAKIIIPEPLKFEITNCSEFDQQCEGLGSPDKWYGAILNGKVTHSFMAQTKSREIKQ